MPDTALSRPTAAAAAALPLGPLRRNERVLLAALMELRLFASPHALAHALQREGLGLQAPAAREGGRGEERQGAGDGRGAAGVALVDQLRGWRLARVRAREGGAWLPCGPEEVVGGRLNAAFQLTRVRVW